MGNKKLCTECGIYKDEGDFGRSSSNKDGLRNYCKECKAIANKEYRAEHKGIARRYAKTYKQVKTSCCKATPHEIAELMKELNFPDEK